ncbi:hypothetical protein Q4603_13130 [Zobellia galactanivorans]|uniref:Conserved hypothetical periplasmic protein n=1 Tax=Zobellia galactanivorans (strain DSM 12802 / CCUG 47099 / CIP 106680 / NCIMB 13871 / Dsij) TaxID=63186 RepID=G0L9R5_ZOBGA|nr:MULTISPECIES: hypothetical protein [Zobellia]MBU3027335.1 hypothetical protein [Zobellia galactanivorans]MDO6809566.1 hypothetical protein [Zobellia galactanivorans]OWW24445.1 hypothetical protein B4Q04_16545 [Zobellia sp. OII3]CAZ94766.1 Conserved hypothetical periplasmic protein [Zobellia galactanivorans]
MKNTLLLVALFSVCFAKSQDKSSEVLPSEIQIKTATLPAPEADKDGAMVYGYDSSGNLTVLREGTNNLVCIGDDPAKEGISVACYSKALEPFMKRGRELTAEGKNTKEKREIQGAEVAAGKWQMPLVPSMLYIYYGSDEAYDKKTGELADGQFRYVIYTPFATVESTGLPSKPHAKGMPWLMDPGTFRAHIMVGPFN